MFDHVGFNVAALEASKAFYVAALAPLGHALLAEGEGWAMIGRSGQGRLWIGTFGPAATPIHLAWTAETRAQVDAFHQAALAAGGRDNGAPGLRPNYGPNYYAAFVLDPDGHNAEAVCHIAA
jgi:catechol 2,3-dioxygenase-like lactoylglutathione lyase family enzyme